MNIRQSKNELRELLRSRRRDIAESDFLRLSEEITAILLQQPEYTSAQTIHCYVSMNNRREVNTHPLIKAMTKEGRRVVVPVTHFEDGRLTHTVLHSFDDLVPNKWGILEPKGGEKCTPEELELVIVPMVGGDEKGHRIGYGGGFYDRFLKKVSCPKIGLCFERNIVAELPVEPFDVSLDKIVTEERIYRKDQDQS